uniref:Peptidase metallopeptidase domain-containing protein n=1 Tax=Plectus sambesii TaxID=2011161 RepID=A0A914VZ79_9BILA
MHVTMRWRCLLAQLRKSRSEVWRQRLAVCASEALTPCRLEHQSEDGAAGGRRVSRPSASDESQQAVTNEIGRCGQSVVRPFKGDRGRSDGRRPIRRQICGPESKFDHVIESMSKKYLMEVPLMTASVAQYRRSAAATVGPIFALRNRRNLYPDRLGHPRLHSTAETPVLSGSARTVVTALPSMPPALWPCLVLLALPSLTRPFPLSRRMLAEAELGSATANHELSSRSLHTITRRWQERHRRRTNELTEALTYLRTYGYLEERAPLTTPRVETALKAFQEVAGVPSDGQLGKSTLLVMRKQRCGNMDIKPSGAKGRRLKRFAQVSKWQGKINSNDVLQLKWFIQEYTKDIPREAIQNVVRRAFNLWSQQIGIPSLRTITLEFEEARTIDQSDINIMWAEGDHDDAYPFDGSGNMTNILAHTFYPNYQETGTLNGDIHFDDFENWVLDNSKTEGTHFPYVLVHEIGHALGLGHSKRQEAIMNPIYKKDPLDTIMLDLDDKCAINWNYIGPTNMCLFVWLMAEILPRAGETNPSHGIGGAVVNNASNGAASPMIAAASGFEAKMNATLHKLRETDIPLCSESNDVQVRYEVLLEQKLDFPRDSARQYSAVACNFLDGLSERVHDEGPAAISVPAAPVELLTAHQYEHGNAGDFRRLVRRATRRSLHRSTSTHRRRHRRDMLTVFDREYFDRHFFKKFFQILLA